MEALTKNRSLLYLAGIVIAAVIVTLPMWIFGTTGAGDIQTHFQFANAVYDSLGHGNVYIQGEPDFNHGYGGVALRFYPPFTYYLMSVTHFLTGDWYNALFLFFALSMAVSGIGLYFLCREFLSDKASFLGAVIYIIEPFHNAQILLNYAYAEFVAGGLIVFCLLFSTRALRRGKPADVAGLGLSFALLLLTNIPTAMIGTMGLAVYCFFSLFGLDRKNWKSRVIKLAAGYFLGGAAAAFHWVRIVTENQWINHSSPKYLTQDLYDYAAHFVDVYNTFFPGDLVLLNLLAMLIPSILIIFFSPVKSARKAIVPIAGVTFFAIFMSTSYSQPVWENISALPKIQFPHRWLTIATIGFSVLVAAGVENLAVLMKERKTAVILWVLVCVGANGFFTYSYIIGANLLDTDFQLIPRQKLEENIERNKTGTHHAVWQTIWTKNSAFQVKEKVVTGDRENEILKWDGYDKKFSVSAGDPVDARIAQFYYPYWRAKINGVDAPVSKTDDGVITVSLPAEAATVEVTFVEPPLVKFFLGVSVVAWLMIPCLFLGGFLFKYFYEKNDLA